ncbi:MAG: PA domain-containing protein [Pseudomonadota bacterium]
MTTSSHLLRQAAALALSLCISASALAAATITIVNRNEAGVGFNDPTPATPVGGNTGVTLGQQRLIAFQHAANIWGRTITSTVPIRIDAAFVPLPCNETGAVLGAAGAIEIFTDFPNAPRPATWYSGALASKLAGTDVASPGQAHIRARFNSRLGLFADCLPGAPFYLGIDNRHGDQIDLVSVLLHEIAHGLGFQSFTDEETGEQFDNLPSIWDFYLVDNRTETRWVDMSNEERRLSAISGNALSWNGERVRTATPQVLAPQSRLTIEGPAAGQAGGEYEVGDATFGPPLSENELRGQLMPVIDQPNGSGFACTPLSFQNATAVRNNIALVDRGGCAFVIKARNVQNAGAIGMVVAENVAGPVTPLGGTDEAVTIPAVRISLEAGQGLKRVLQRRSRTASGVIAELGVDPNRRQGADRQLRIRMHAPPEYEPGSSVSHYTVDARPNQLMEPSINPDLPHEVRPPRDLTYPLLQDIGW